MLANNKYANKDMRYGHILLPKYCREMFTSKLWTRFCFPHLCLRRTMRVWHTGAYNAISGPSVGNRSVRQGRRQRWWQAGQVSTSTRWRAAAGQAGRARDLRHVIRYADGCTCFTHCNCPDKLLNYGQRDACLTVTLVAGQLLLPRPTVTWRTYA